MEKDKEKTEKKEGDKKKKMIDEDLPPYLPAVQVGCILNILIVRAMQYQNGTKVDPI